MEKRDFYQKLRISLEAWAKGSGKNNKTLRYILLAPDFFHLLCKILLDPRVSRTQKAKVGGAIAYFMSPLDVMPEGIVGPAGYLDDVALAAYVLNDILESAGPEVLREHWAGDGDVLEQIRSVIRVADQLVGSGVWRNIKRFLKRK
jgi:uncharacterized membrane protein YkvA (DUF1232 family)